MQIRPIAAHAAQVAGTAGTPPSPAVSTDSFAPSAPDSGAGLQSASSAPATPTTAGAAREGTVRDSWAVPGKMPLTHRVRVAPDGGRAFVSGTDGTVSALEPATGQALWNVKVGELAGHAVSSQDGSALLAVTADGTVMCLDPATGGERWRQSLGTACGDPPVPVKDGSVVLRVKDGRVFRLDGSNGEVAWSRHLGKDLNRGPLVASDGTVYVTDWDLTVHALNPADGSTRWAAQKGSVTSMALDSHDTLYLARDYGGVCAVDPATGQDLWKVTPTVGPRSLDNARPAISFWQAPARNEDLDSTRVLLNPSLHDRIVATCDGGQVYALDARNGNLDWAVLPGARGSMPHPEVLPDGTVVVGCGDYNVYGLDPDTGRQLWSWAIPRGDQPRPTAGADGRVYCRDDQGVLHASQPPQREDPLKKAPETGPGSVAPTTIQVEEQWVDVGGVRIPRRRSS